MSTFSIMRREFSIGVFLSPSRLLWLMAFALVVLESPAMGDRHPDAIRIVFVGDIMLDNGPGHALQHGTDPFLGCAEILLDADLTVGNLECVLGKGGKQLDKPYTFRGARQSPRFLKPYFDALSLANNHSWDYGADGFAEMLQVLKENEIPFFGGGMTIQEARQPLVIDCKGKRIALLAFNEFRADNYAATPHSAGNVPLKESWVLEDVKRAKTELQCDIVIPFLHWGEEMEPQPRADQRFLARQMIDAGAAAVIGAHPHVTQTIEVYRRAPIIYSLGNFVFDYYPGDPEEWIGWIATLDVAPDGAIELETTAVVLDRVGLPRLLPVP